MADPIVGIFCRVCRTLMLLEDAVAGHCCQEPREANCPYKGPPQTGVEMTNLIRDLRTIDK